MTPLVATHLALAACAVGTASASRAWPLAAALTSVVAVDLVFVFARGWPQTTLASFVGPAVVVIAALRTFRLPQRAAGATALPILVLALAAWFGGPSLGSAGVAWLLVAAHAYAAVTGFAAITFGHEDTAPLHARLVGLFVATSAPGVVGWTFRALGHSMRPAAVLDGVFVGAIVVWSLAAWTTRSSTYFSPRWRVLFSGR
jgi:hypothetical protein